MKKIVTKNGQEFYVWGSRKEASKEIALIVEGMKCAFVEGAEMDDSLYIKYTDGSTYFFNKFEETGKFRKTNFDEVIFSNDCISVAYGKVVLRNVDDCDEFYSPEKDSEEKIWYFDEKESEAIRVERKIMSKYDFKFYVNGREFKTLCNTVKNAETFGVKFTVGGHTITAEISDKCFFKTIDGIELNGVKTDYYICKDYLNMNGFIYKLNDSFSTFINTVLTGAVGTVDVLLCKILEKVEMINPETKETVTTTDSETVEREKIPEEKNPDLNNFHNAIIKALGMTRAKEVGYTIQGLNVFFEYQGEMYKCYTPQSKLYKLSGQRFNLITWKDLKKEYDEKSDDKSDGVYTARPPPESSLLNLTINKLIKREDF